MWAQQMESVRIDLCGVLRSRRRGFLEHAALLSLCLHICFGAPRVLTQGLEIILLSLLNINHKEGKFEWVGKEVYSEKCKWKESFGDSADAESTVLRGADLKDFLLLSVSY